MSFLGSVMNGVVVFEGPDIPPEGSGVRVEVVTNVDDSHRIALEKVAQHFPGLPGDFVELRLELFDKLDRQKPIMTQEEWVRRVRELAGSWQGDFERPPQDILE